MHRRTTSGIEIDPVHGPDGGAEKPGEYPFTRGPYPTMYRGRLWTMRQYAGFGDAAATNQRFHSLLAAGQTGLSVAFDLPTQMGLDSDHELSRGEVGKVGVAIDSIEDMRALFEGIPLDEVSTSMTINATAAVLLLLYQIVAEERGLAPAHLRGTVQNDILKEYAARGTYIYPPTPSMRLVTDLFSYCAEHMPAWNTISISGYHIREAGSTAAQEIAFTIANGLAYVSAANDAGLTVDDVGPRLSFFWNSHRHLLEEVAKFRAARRLWATLMVERGATDSKAQAMRFHVQTAGSSLTAQQPENNIVRTTLQALAAVLGGAQSIHTNAFDEALGLPTDRSALLALRTQQVIAHESGVADTADPFGGSYVIEYLTDELEAAARKLIDLVESEGGAAAAIESGLVQRLIADSAYEEAKAIESGETVVVGVNRYMDADSESIPAQEIDPEIERSQVQRLVTWRERRDTDVVERAIANVSATALTTDNILPAMKGALEAGATVGEVSDALRGVFGVYRPGA